jgi:homoserine dehydrogenase
MVAPFLLPSDSPLSTVNGVYNAIEVIAEPLGNIMFYGQGAGAGATASAVVGDILPLLTYGNKNPIVPGFNRVKTSAKDSFSVFKSRKYIALAKGNEEKVKKIFGNVAMLDGNECAFITEEMSENETLEKLSSLGVPALAVIRFL